MPLIEDDVLVGMFAELAESVEVPASGAADALAAVAAVRTGRTGAAPVVSLAEARARRRKRAGAAVGLAAAVAIVGGVTVAARGGGPSASSSQSATSIGAPAAAVPSAAAAASVAPQFSQDQSLDGLAPSAAGTGAGSATAPAAAAPRPVPSATGAAGAAAVTVPDRVIRTGDVDLVVPARTVPATVTRLEGAATGLGGFLEDSQSQAVDPKSGGVPTASVTLRVPAKRFEALLGRVQALGRVVTSTTTGKDVTAQYVDLGARLKALMTSRDTYLTILSQARTVNDTLSVQQRLDDLQQQIEELQGQQNQLGSQSDLGTLTVEVSEPTPAPPPASAPPKARSGLSAAWHTAGDRFRRGAESVVAALGTVALLAIAALVLLAGYRIGRRAYVRRMV